MEYLALVTLAYALCKLSPLFKPTAPEDRIICWGTVLHSLLDDGPFEWAPGTYNSPQGTEPENMDPNTNPHYAWAEEDDHS